MKFEAAKMADLEWENIRADDASNDNKFREERQRVQGRTASFISVQHILSQYTVASGSFKTLIFSQWSYLCGTYINDSAKEGEDNQKGNKVK